MAKVWEEYVTIDPYVTVDRRHKIIEAYDKIVAAAEGEGVELLAAGMKQNGGNKIRITSDDRKKTAFSYRDNVPTLNLNFIEISALDVNEGVVRKTLSLMGTIVHESAHAAHGMGHVFEAIMKVSDIHPEVRQLLAPYKDAFAQAILSNDRDKLMSVFESKPEREKIVLTFLGGLFLNEMQQLASGNETGAAQEKLKKIGYYADDGSPIHEHGAVLYTDAFMQKNGCNEPIRGRYSNQVDGDKNLDAVKNPTCGGLRPTKGFKFDALGNESLGDFLSIPEIRPYQPDKAPPTRFK